LKISEETKGYSGGNKFHFLQNFIEFESLCAEGRESEKADIITHNKGALQSDPRGKHKTRMDPYLHATVDCVAVHSVHFSVAK
jgi:hypothetical protein